MNNFSHQSIIALGSNMGNKSFNIYSAINLLSEHHRIQIKSTSNLFHNKAVGLIDESPADFVNAAVLLETDFESLELLEYCQSIEAEMGRIRSEEGKISRIIDLDIIFFDNCVINTRELIIPHPRYREREFVMVPLAEIIKDFRYRDEMNI